MTKKSDAEAAEAAAAIDAFEGDPADKPADAADGAAAEEAADEAEAAEEAADEGPTLKLAATPDGSATFTITVPEDASEADYESLTLAGTTYVFPVGRAVAINADHEEWLRGYPGLDFE